MIPFPSQLDDRDQLLRLAGGFWSGTYEGQSLLSEALIARSNLTKQTFERLQEAIDCRSRLDIPLYRKEYWRQLVLKKSVVNSFPSLYGEDISYGDGSVYGKRSASLPFVYPIDAELDDCRLIANRLTYSSVNLVSGLDFVIDKKYKLLRLKENPFDNSGFSTQTTEDGDVELTMWLYRPSIDREYVYQHFGYVVNLWAETSQSYKNLVNNVYDCLVDGTSIGKTLDAVTAITGIPLAKGDETVKELYRDKTRHLVITDKNVYAVAIQANVSVEEGDYLTQDQSICDGLEYYEFNRGDVPASVNGVSLLKDMLPGSYIGEVGFNNKTQDLIVDSDLNGKTKVSFALGGHPFDVEKFWNDVHAKGLASGRTLADVLDTRTEKVGEPTAASLPATINPFQFLIENIFRYGAFLVKIKSSAVDPAAVGLDKLTYVKRLLPPHTMMILIVSMPDLQSEIVTESDDTTPTTFTCSNTLSEDLEATSLESAVRSRIVSGVFL
jgi:hypothetical protein